MFRMRVWLAIAAAALICTGALPLRAQSRNRIVECSSINGGRNLCEADTRGGVNLDRRTSDAACQEWYSWGFYDRRSVPGSIPRYSMLQGVIRFLRQER